MISCRPNNQMHRTATPRCDFESAGIFGRWIGSESPVPVAVGDLGRWASSRFMRMPHIIIGAALIVAFVVGCSKSPSKLVSDCPLTVPYLGVVNFTDSTPKYFSIGGGKSCVLKGTTGSNGTTIEVVFQETNTDKTVQVFEERKVRFTPGDTYILKSGDMAVRFIPEFKAR